MGFNDENRTCTEVTEPGFQESRIDLRLPVVQRKDLVSVAGGQLQEDTNVLATLFATSSTEVFVQYTGLCTNVVVHCARNAAVSYVHSDSTLHR